MPDTGMSIEEAAERLQVPPDEVARMLSAGVLRPAEADPARVDTVSVIEQMGRQLSAITAKLGTPSQASTADVLGAALVPVLVLLFALAWFVEIFSVRAGSPLIPLWAMPVLALATLGPSWWLARRDPDFQTTRGIGSTLYGDKATDEGRIGTAWLVFAMVPLLPMDSYVIVEKGEAQVEILQRSQRLLLRKRDGLYWPQVLPLWLGAWALLLGATALAVFVG
ncbi:MAG: hypothetical protein R3F61_38410 [Myxococcota bacterium]